MNIYNSKCVHFEWNDKLKDKKVLLSNCITEFKQYLFETRDTSALVEVQESNNTDYPFTDGITEYKFCYYDPLLKYKIAFNANKSVQTMRNDEVWEDISDIIEVEGDFDWDDRYDYRWLTPSKPLKDRSIFNECFLYTQWRDSLEGKTAFLSDNPSLIETRVEKNAPRYFVHKNTAPNNDKYPFRLESDGGAAFRFCYYDPLYEYKVALKEGKRVQMRVAEYAEWFDVDRWDDRYEYRILEYRPYQGNEFMTLNNIYAPIWVKCKATGDLYLVTEIGSTFVRLGASCYNYQRLFEEFTFKDGSVCGKETV